MPNYPQKISITVFGLLLIIFLTSMIPENGDLKGYNTKLQIINPSSGKIHNFQTKIAISEKERVQGLMFIKSLPENYAMLFKFEKTQQIYMWMKNTKIPLDMIFIDENDRIVNIKKMAIPESTSIISSKFPVIKVLEINGGLCDKLNIRIGDLVK